VNYRSIRKQTIERLRMWMSGSDTARAENSPSVTFFADWSLHDARWLTRRVVRESNPCSIVRDDLDRTDLVEHAADHAFDAVKRGTVGRPHLRSAYRSNTA